MLRKALSHFNCDLCGKYTISDNVLGDHIEFYSDTKAFSTHFDYDLCAKYTIPDSVLGEHIEFQRDQSTLYILLFVTQMSWDERS